MSDQSTRREFLRNSAALGAALSVFGTVSRSEAAEADPKPGQNIVVGVMGTAGRGTTLAAGFAALGAEVRYICDVDDAHVSAAQKTVAARQKTAPQGVKDFRKILDDRTVDALVIAAPDHWHAPASILACAAGKHVYVEKPCCHNPREGELMIEAARRSNRVVQTGTQRRSWAKVIEGIELVRKGELGRVLFSRGWYNNTRGETGKGKAVPVPPGLDWTLWQGPAPERPYRDNIVHYKWHWFWHWGTGELGNNGVHALDVCRWGLNVDYPRRVTAGGGRYHFADDQETPDTHIVTYDFGDKAIAFEGRSCQPRGFEGSMFGIAFYGDKGSMIIDGNGYVIYDPKNKQVKKVTGPGADAPHLQNFLDCIKTGARPTADVEEGAKSAILCHLGNIAYRTGRTVNLDPQTHRIVGDPEAQALWGREYRPGWAV